MEQNSRHETTNSRIIVEISLRMDSLRSFSPSKSECTASTIVGSNQQWHCSITSCMSERPLLDCAVPRKTNINADTLCLRLSGFKRGRVALALTAAWCFHKGTTQ